MGAHIGQLVGHVILHKVVLAGQVCQLRALCHGALGIKQGLQLCAAGKLRAQLAALGQKAALTAAECRAGRKAAGIFDLCVFPAGDLFVHCIPPAESGHSSVKKQKGQRLPQKLLRQGTALKHCFRPQEPRIQNGRPRIRAGVTMQGLDQAFLTVSTRAAKLLGSLMAISDSILRFSSMPAFFRPAMKVE